VVASTGRQRVQFGPPDRGKETAARPPRGRMCEQIGCQTILSTYNSSDACWLHTPPAYRHALSRN